MAVQDYIRAYRRPSARRFYQIFGGLLLFWIFVLCATSSQLRQTARSLTEAGHGFSRFRRPDAGQSSHVPTMGTEDTAATLVVASLKSSNMSWLHGLPTFDHKIYVVDDRNAAHTVPRNKGREAMVFLTYIIDYYDQLAPVTVFLHADRFQWHNDDPDYDNLHLLRRLKIDRALDEGYVNLRCAWWFGCDDGGIAPLERQKEYKEMLKEIADYKPFNYQEIYADALNEMMPGRSVPEQVEVACCAQFAVSRDAIHNHSKDDYIRYREWILQSEHIDNLIGRVFEYLWHIMFGKEARSCPSAGSCYCETYGLCDLECTGDGDCGVYTKPPDEGYQIFPEGWPYVGFDGEPRQPQVDSGDIHRR